MSGTQLLGGVEYGFNQGLKTVSEGLVVEVTFIVERLLDVTHRQLFGHGPTVKPTESDPHVVECVGVGDPPRVDIKPKTFPPTCLSYIQSMVFFITPDMVP